MSLLLVGLFFLFNSFLLVYTGTRNFIASVASASVGFCAFLSNFSIAVAQKQNFGWVILNHVVATFAMHACSLCEHAEIGTEEIIT